MRDEWELVRHFVVKVTECPAVKAALAAVLAVLHWCYGEFNAMYGTIIMLYIVDFALGYYHAWLNPDIVPESRRMRQGIIKLAGYALLLLVGYRLAATDNATLLFVAAAAESMICLTEAKSILENYKLIAFLKGYKVDVIDRILRIVEGKLGGDE